MSQFAFLLSSGMYVKLWSKYRRGFISFIVSILPLMSLVMLMSSVSMVFSMIPAVIACVIIGHRIYKRIFKGFGEYSISNELSTRVLLALVPLTVYFNYSHATLFGIVILAIIPLVPIGEPLLGKLLRVQGLKHTNLPGIKKTNETLIPMRVFSNYHFFLIVSAIVVTTLNFSLYILFGIILIEVVLLVTAGVDLALRLRNSLSSDENLVRAIEEYKPKFVLYFAAPKNTEYQVAMWIEYLERIDEPFMIILRNHNSFNKIIEMTSCPVVVCPRILDLDNVTVPSITTAFYVNNGMYNSHLVRNNNILHVQLLHGDSDKSFSYNPVNAMMDKIFVAGQAAIDRYHNHGVNIPIEKFEIVGRPQVEKVQRGKESNWPVEKVLYAPTWKGNYNDTNYCSLPIGLEIIKSLLAKDIAVVFRPHPYSYKDPVHKKIINDIQELLKCDARKSQLGHKWGNVAELEMTIFDCFNSVDAMISDVSSVVPDFLFSAKPFAMVAMSESGENFFKEFPLSTVAYVIESDLSNLESMLNELLVNDNKKVERVKACTHYLGPFKQDGYADHFVRIAKKLINNE